MITILADDSNCTAGSDLFDLFLSKGIQAEYVSLKDVTVKPCINCGGCTNKTYGKCVVRDDGDWIYPKILHSDALVVVTPILFGGYSVKTKRVLDKFGLIMDRHYFIQHGELTKGGMVGRPFRYYVLGIQDTDNALQEGIFKTMVNETLIITRGRGKAYVKGPDANDWPFEEIVREAASA